MTSKEVSLGFVYKYRGEDRNLKLDQLSRGVGELLAFDQFDHPAPSVNL